MFKDSSYSVKIQEGKKTFFGRPLQFLVIVGMHCQG